MNTLNTHIAFAGARRVAAGTLREVLPVLKKRFDADRSDMVLVFEIETGRQVDFDLHGTLEEAVARGIPETPRGPGRPKLGVTSREITLFPSHWEWLESQPNGASAALRRIVGEAMKQAPTELQARRVRESLGRILWTMAGDRPHFEEATRALYAGDTARFMSLVAKWPKDIREFALARLGEAANTE